jgi:hypothetical protein
VADIAAVQIAGDNEKLSTVSQYPYDVRWSVACPRLVVPKVKAEETKTAPGSPIKVTEEGLPGFESRTCS